LRKKKKSGGGAEFKRHVFRRRLATRFKQEKGPTNEAGGNLKRQRKILLAGKEEIIEQRKGTERRGGKDKSCIKTGKIKGDLSGVHLWVGGKNSCLPERGTWRTKEETQRLNA